MRVITTTDGSVLHGACEIASKVGEFFGGDRFIPTYLKCLDDLVRGWPRGGVSLIAARPGTGKTSLLEVDATFQVGSGRSVVFAALEMGWQSHLVSMAERSGSGGVEQFTRLMGDEPGELVMLDHAGSDVGGLYSVLMRDHVEFDVLYVDYLQLLGSREGAARGRSRELGLVLQGLAQIARSKRAAVVVASQLNRQIHARDRNGSPLMSDLAESGYLEQLSSLVVVPVRPSVMRGTQPPSSGELCHLHVIKARFARPGVVPVSWYGQDRRFEGRGRA